MQSVPEEEGDRHSVRDPEQRRRQSAAPVQRLLRRLIGHLHHLQRQRGVSQVNGRRRRRRGGRRGSAGEPRALAQIQVRVSHQIGFFG